METKRIEVRVQEKKTAEGRKFLTYSTYSKNGRKTEVKFRKEVPNLPTKDCFIVVNVDDMNLNTSGRFPVLWVKAIQAVEDYETANAELNKKKLDEYFG